MDQFVLPAWPLIVAASLGPLIVGVYFRMGQIEAQLRAMDDPVDGQALKAIAGCMIRGRICKGALLALYGASMTLSALTLWILSRDVFGWLVIELTLLGLLAAVCLVAVALVLISVETYLSMEPMEMISRRKLNAAGRLS